MEPIGDHPALNAICIYRLDELEDQIFQIKRVILDGICPPGVDRDRLKLVHAMLKKYKGSMDVEFLNAPEGGGGISRKISKIKILFCPPLFFELLDIMPREAMRAYTGAPRADEAILQGW